MSAVALQQGLEVLPFDFLKGQRPSVCFPRLLRVRQAAGQVLAPDMRAVGQNPDASRYAGIPVKRTIVLALTMSGAMAGLAGAVLVFGSESHRMVTDGSTAGFTGSAGFNGIVAALFGGLHALWTIPASFLFGGLLVGGLAMQRAVQVPSALILALNGLVVVFVVSSDRLRRRLLERDEKLGPDAMSPDDAPGRAPPPAGVADE